MTSRLLIALTLIVAIVAAPRLRAAEHAGRVTFAGQPVPGATVTAIQGDKRITVQTDAQGIYRFPSLDEGSWTVRVEMIGFAPAQQEVTVAAAPLPVSIALALRPFDEITRDLKTVQADRVTSTPLPVVAAAPAPARGGTAASGAGAAPAPPPVVDEPNAADAADGLLINGSVNNGAASPFAQAAAFGNNRNNRRSLYNGSLGAVIGNSAFDARPYSFTGERASRPSYNDTQVLGTFGGPLRLPRLTRNPINVFVGFQKNLDHNATTESALVPSLLERGGDFSRSGGPIVDPATGLPFLGNTIPGDRISAEALALLAYYPRPNLAAGGRANFQAPVLTATNQDNLQSRFALNLNTRNSLTGTFAVQRTQTDTTSLFNFTDHTSTGNVDATAVWSRRFSPFLSTRVRYQFTRAFQSADPFFANRANVSGDAGITGNDQSPANWGPPTLTFANGIAPLVTAPFADTTNNTHGVQAEALVNRPGHSMTIGGVVRRAGVTALGQPNGRGALSFTGSVTGSPLADFLLGLPQSSAIAVGNRDKRLRAWSYDLFFTDDWRVTPGLTINAGVRWEFEGPMRERDGRLSNLELAADFSAARLITGDVLKPDRQGIQPRVGVAWRPVAGSSLVVRAGYGIYRNTNVYQSLALLLAQQPPFSTALALDRALVPSLTLRNAFTQNAASAPATFAIDPDFKVGDAQNWQLLMQRDLPGSLTVTAAYLGAYGRNLLQEFLPNTYAPGASNPCASCPSGFVYLTSNGSSSRHAGQFQLRRRLRDGFTASAQYTIAKATDDAGAFTGAAMSGAAIAQDWRDLDAERAPSNFDQRHQLTAQVQYTTGVGVAGGGMLTGVKGALIKGWTFTANLNAGSGLPLTPTYLASVAGITGTMRAALTGASTSDIPEGLFLNPAAYRAPASGQWGDAGRNSITGPSQFNLSAGVTRSFPWGDRISLDWRLDASNVLNRVTYATVNTIVGSPQFGASTRANTMRKVQTSLRLRF